MRDSEIIEALAPRLRKIKLSGSQLFFLRQAVKTDPHWAWIVAIGAQPIHQVFDADPPLDKPAVSLVDLREFPEGVFSNVGRMWELTLFGRLIGLYHELLSSKDGAAS